MTSDTSTHDVVAGAKALAPLIKEYQEEMETLRRLSDPVVQGLANAGIFRAYYPRSIGGLEVSPLTFMEAIEEISRADGSTGWCAMITGDTGILGGRLKKDVALKLFGHPPDVRIAGSLIPLGEARITDGGFRISGYFTFASGIDYANWLGCHCKVFDDNGPKIAPQGDPETVVAFVPVDQADVRDTWSVAGMCATGSHDFVVDDVFVPAERSFALLDQPNEPGPLFNPRTLMVSIMAPNAACLMGIARGAMDTFVDLVAPMGSNMSGGFGRGSLQDHWLNFLPQIVRNLPNSLPLPNWFHCFHSTWTHCGTVRRCRLRWPKPKPRLAPRALTSLMLWETSGTQSAMVTPIPAGRLPRRVWPSPTPSANRREPWICFLTQPEPPQSIGPTRLRGSIGISMLRPSIGPARPPTSICPGRRC